MFQSIELKNLKATDLNRDQVKFSQIQSILYTLLKSFSQTSGNQIQNLEGKFMIIENERIKLSKALITANENVQQQR